MREKVIHGGVRKKTTLIIGCDSMFLGCCGMFVGFFFRPAVRGTRTEGQL